VVGLVQLAYEADQAGRELVPGAHHAGEPEPPGRPEIQDRIRGGTSGWNRKRLGRPRPGQWRR
jgi:hypothetical protein